MLEGGAEARQWYERARDEEHLRLLAIFYYVHAGIVGLFALFPLIYVFIGLAFVFSPPPPSPGAAPPPPALGWVFVAIGATATLVGETMAALSFAAARALQKRSSLTLLMVVAGLCCLHMPLGTLLGVFTFVVLGRPNVRRLFATGAT